MTKVRGGEHVVGWREEVRGDRPHIHHVPDHLCAASYPHVSARLSLLDEP